MMAAAMLARALLLAALPLSMAACAIADTIGPSTCDRGFAPPNDPEADNQPTLYVDGTVEDGVYRSEIVASGELLSFKGGAYYKIAHHLGSTPDWTLFYLSFSRYGIAQGGVYAQATGNQAELLLADEEFIWVLNDSCSDYWLRVVAGTGAQP